MCDKSEFQKLREDVQHLREITAVQSEQIKTLFKATRIQFWSVWGAFIILLLTVVYGALGERGFNAVTNEARKSADIRE